MRPRNLFFTRSNLEAEHSYLQSGSCAAVAIVNRREQNEVKGVLETVLTRLEAERGSLVFFVRYRSPPVFSFRVEERVESFAVSADLYAKLGELRKELLRTNAVYQVFQFLLRMNVFLQLRVVQFGRPGDSVRPLQEQGLADIVVNWVIPHRGHVEYLEQCLNTASMVVGPQDRLRVGLDDVATPDLAELFRRFPRAEAHYNREVGVGPYVMRNKLTRLAEEFTLFQDSDDFPTVDRRTLLLAEILRNPNCGMCGSHELRVDELEGVVVPVRYPLDVQQAMTLGPTYCLLHPTAMIRRCAFEAAGGFSTIATHSMDLQFLWRSVFFFNSINVDEFAYVRRRREGSLTTAPSTKKGSWVRLRFQNKWANDFSDIARGIKSLEGSSLAVAHRPVLAEVNPAGATDLSD